MSCNNDSNREIGGKNEGKRGRKKKKNGRTLFYVFYHMRETITQHTHTHTHTHTYIYNYKINIYSYCIKIATFKYNFRFTYIPVNVKIYQHYMRDINVSSNKDKCFRTKVTQQMHFVQKKNKRQVYQWNQSMNNAATVKSELLLL